MRLDKAMTDQELRFEEFARAMPKLELTSGQRRVMTKVNEASLHGAKFGCHITMKVNFAKKTIDWTCDGKH